LNPIRTTRARQAGESLASQAGFIKKWADFRG
jgi:hypothetical protein